MEDKKLLVMALLELAKDNMNQLKRIEKRIAEILEVEGDGCGYYGHVSDGIYDGYSVDELLEKVDYSKKAEERLRDE